MLRFGRSFNVAKLHSLKTFRLDKLVPVRSFSQTKITFNVAKTKSNFNSLLPSDEEVLKAFKMEEQEQSATWGFVTFYFKTLIAAILTGITITLVKASYFTTKTDLDIIQVLPNTEEEVMRSSLDIAYTLYTRYKEQDLLYDPSSIKTHEKLSTLLENMVQVAISLGATEFENIDWRIHIVKDDASTIHVLPCGDIFIHKGLILLIDDPVRFAFIFAHELGHIHHRHYEDRYTRLATRWTWTTPLCVIPTGGFRPIGVTNKLFYLNYGPEEERCADHFA